MNKKKRNIDEFIILCISVFTRKDLSLNLFLDMCTLQYAQMNVYCHNANLLFDAYHCHSIYLDVYVTQGSSSCPFYFKHGETGGMSRRTNAVAAFTTQTDDSRLIVCIFHQLDTIVQNHLLLFHTVTQWTVMMKL